MIVYITLTINQKPMLRNFGLLQRKNVINYREVLGGGNGVRTISTLQDQR